MTPHFWALLYQLTKRDIVVRYRGSILGILWSFVNPLLMLLVYTFVFSVVFKARFGTENGAMGEFAIILFTGLILHVFLTESITRAPVLITTNTNFVKKIVFPLEVLPVMVVGSNLFHLCTSLLVLGAGILMVQGTIPATILYLPILLLPFILLTLGVTFFLASFGVFVRDVVQMVRLATMLLLFLSPIFYPVSALPGALQKLIYLNPLTYIVQETRAVMINGTPLDWEAFSAYTLCSLIVGWLGFTWFMRTRRGFADVL